MPTADTSPVTAAQPIIGGKRAGPRRDHDVLRRPALQPDRVDENIEQDRRQEQRRGHEVGRDRHQQDGEERQQHARASASSGATRPAGSGRLRVRAINASRSRSLPHVDGAGGAGTQRDRQHGECGRQTGAGAPGAISTPTRPVNTTSDITRGFNRST